MLDLILLTSLLVSSIAYLYVRKKQQNKSFIVMTGCLGVAITIILVISAICTILNFIFRYLI
jgi:hypothetical protein